MDRLTWIDTWKMDEMLVESMDEIINREFYIAFNNILR